MSLQLILALPFFRLLFYQESKPTEKASACSVVICAHNELPNLQKNLSTICEQQHQKYEVLIVLDRSTDGSYEWLKTQTEIYSHLKVITVDKVPNGINPKKHALKTGIAAAKFDWLLLTDADCQPASSHWVDRMSQFDASSTQIKLGISLYEKRPGFLNLFIRFETYQTALTYLSRALNGKPYMGVGRNLAYSKTFFLAKKGLDDIAKITGGDDDLFVNRNANKHNTSIAFNSESITYSSPKRSWRSFIQQKKRHLSVGKHYKLSDKIYLASLQITTNLSWLCLILQLFTDATAYQIIAACMMTLRWIGQYVVYYKVSIKFGDDFKPWLLPILELFYMFYHLIIGSIAIRSKRIQWK